MQVSADLDHTRMPVTKSLVPCLPIYPPETVILSMVYSDTDAYLAGYVELSATKQNHTANAVQPQAVPVTATTLG